MKDTAIERLRRGCMVALLQAGLVIGCSASEAGKPGMTTAEDSSGDRPTLRARLEPTGNRDAGTYIVFDLVNEGPGSARFSIWGTPLEWPPTADIFLIHGPDGREREYQGRMVKRAQPRAEDMLILAEGEQRVVSIDLADAYEFDMTGAYRVRYRESAARAFSLRNSGLQFAVNDGLLVTLD